MTFDIQKLQADLMVKRVQREKRYMSIRAAAREIGIEWSHLHKIENGIILNPGITTILLCCAWLKTKIQDYVKL